MSTLVTADVTLTLGPDKITVRASAMCKRLVDRSIACTIVDVMLDDRSVLEGLTAESLAVCRERLANAFLVEQMRGRESISDAWAPDDGPGGSAA